MQFSIRDRVSQIKEQLAHIKLPEPIQKLVAMAKELQEEGLANVVGVEINAAYIKLMKIDHAKSPYTVESCIVESIPSGLIVKGEIKDYAAVSSLLKELFQKHSIPTQSIALAIPRSLAIIKNITIDKRLTPEDIESRAWIEASRLFPELIGEVYLDFCVTGPAEQDPSQLEVILVACRKDNIKSYLDVMRQAGLTTKMIDINCYALERALHLLVSPEQQDQTVALLNIGIDISALIVAKKDKLLYAHDQAFDGGRLMTLTNKYLKDAGISLASVTSSLLDDAGYQAILKETLTSHLRHTVHFFYSSRPNVGINKIIISGDCATVPLIATFIQQEIGIEAEIANPAANLRLGGKVNADEFKEKIPALIECCGLAISKLEI